MTAPNLEAQLQRAEGVVLAAAYHAVRRHDDDCPLCAAVRHHRSALRTWAENTPDESWARRRSTPSRSEPTPADVAAKAGSGLDVAKQEGRLSA